MASEKLQIPIDRFGRVVLPKAQVIDQGGWLVVKTSSKRKITPEEVSKLIEESREGKDRS